MTTYVPQGYESAVEQYEKAMLQGQEEMSALASMVAMIKSKDGGKMTTDELFSYVMEVVMNKMVDANGASKLGVFGSKLDVQSECSKVANEVAGDIHYLISHAQSSQVSAANLQKYEDVANRLCERMNWLEHVMGQSPAPAWIDKTTASKIVQECKGFKTVFATYRDMAPFTGQNVAYAIQHWSTDPTRTMNGGKTGSEYTQEMMSHLNTLSSALESSSSVLTSQIQNVSAQITQEAGAEKAALQAVINFERAANSALRGG